MKEISLVNYSHRGCEPLKSITQLSEEEAFKKAKEICKSNKGIAFGRFEDFVNYYPKRINTEKSLHQGFKSKGGKPEVETIIEAVLVHSDKSSYTDRPYVEMLKNIDSMDRYLYGIKTEDAYYDRVQMLLNDMKIIDKD